jgi:hypothetical protein
MTVQQRVAQATNLKGWNLNVKTVDFISEKVIEGEGDSESAKQIDLADLQTERLTFFRCRFVHKLNLDNSRIKRAILFSQCVFEQGISLEGCRAGSIDFHFCFASSIVLNRAHISGHLIIRSTVLRQLSLQSARVESMRVIKSIIGDVLPDSYYRKVVLIGDVNGFPDQIAQLIKQCIEYESAYKSAVRSAMQKHDWELPIDLSNSVFREGILIESSLLAGQLFALRIIAQSLVIADSSIWGHLEVSTSKLGLLRLDASNSNGKPIEVWGQLNAASLECREFELKGVILHGPLLIYRCDKIASFRWAWIPDPTSNSELTKRFDAASQSESLEHTPSYALGGINVSDCRFRTRFALQGVHVGLSGAALHDKILAAKRPIRLLDLKHPFRQLEGSIRITDCVIGFDLSIAGPIVGFFEPEKLRTEPDARSFVAKELFIEGVRVGGDLDLRGLGFGFNEARDRKIFPREDNGRFFDEYGQLLNGRIVISNVTIGGDVRCGLAELRRQLGASADIIDVPGLASTYCSTFSVRNASIKGDAHLDALRTVRNNDWETSGRNGAVEIIGSNVHGDLSFVHYQEGTKYEEVNTSAEFGPLCDHAFIMGKCDLTGTKCDHLIISGRCFRIHKEVKLPVDVKHLRRMSSDEIKNLQKVLHDDLCADGVVFRRIAVKHFELRDHPIDRLLDLQDTRVDWWDFPSTDKKKSEVFKKLLDVDPSLSRETVASIERSLFQHGDADGAEEMRKAAFQYAKKKHVIDRKGSPESIPRWKNVLGINDRALYPLGYWFGQFWGYGQLKWSFIASIVLILSTFALAKLWPHSLEHSFAWRAAHPLPAVLQFEDPSNLRLQSQSLADSLVRLRTALPATTLPTTTPTTVSTKSPNVEMIRPDEHQEEGSTLSNSTAVMKTVKIEREQDQEQCGVAEAFIFSVFHTIHLEGAEAADEWEPSATTPGAVPVFFVLSCLSWLVWIALLLAISQKVLRLLGAKLESE